MRRLFMLLIMAFLPLQSSWAVNNSYCKHESGTYAQHFGHHDHDHQHSAKDGVDDLPELTVSSYSDTDCAVCHAGCTIAAFCLTASSLSLNTFLHKPDGQAIFTSPFLREPERPQWRLHV